MADDYLGDEVDRFLADHGLSTADISTWICHPGGPKVLDSIENAIGLPPEARCAQPGFDAGERQHLVRVGARRAAPDDRRRHRRGFLRGDARDGSGLQLRAAAAELVRESAMYYLFILAVGARAPGRTRGVPAKCGVVDCQRGQGVRPRPLSGDGDHAHAAPGRLRRRGRRLCTGRSSAGWGGRWWPSWCSAPSSAGGV